MIDKILNVNMSLDGDSFVSDYYLAKFDNGYICYGCFWCNLSKDQDYSMSSNNILDLSLKQIIDIGLKIHFQNLDSDFFQGFKKVKDINRIVDFKKIENCFM